MRTTLHGIGFDVTDVPNYLDEGHKSSPAYVFKTKGAAVRRANAEAAWSAQYVSDQVEGVVATQIEGFDDLWFVVFIYTDETAAKSVQREALRAGRA
jgi:hypothetical protein